MFAESLEELVSMRADAYFDLLYEDEQNGERHNNQSGNTGQQHNHAKITSQYFERDESGSIAQQNTRAKITAQFFEKNESASTAEQNNKARIASLSKLLPAPVFINSVIQPLSHIHPGFIRINGWPGFLKMPLVEAAAAGPEAAKKAGEIFGDQVRLVKDIPGLVTPRIISMIINEARITLAAGTSTREEIDTAMKLGTGYPFGPFEWEERIGAERVRRLGEGMTVDG
jgi:hypothetical protein